MGWVRAVAVTPDGRRAVSASEDGTLRVWDLESAQNAGHWGLELRALEGHEQVNSVAVTPDGRRAVSASEDHTLRVWALESGQVLRTLAGHTGAIKAVADTSDGRRAVAAGSDRALAV